MSEERADKLLLKAFPELTRSKIQMLIGKGKILYKVKENWKAVTKASQKFSTDYHEWKILDDEETNYVSRGAVKLKKAIEHFNFDVEGLLCLDIGLSTGGFTDYLIQMGAQKILGIDVGKKQLHSSLRDHPKLVWKDKINAREELSQEILNNFFVKTGKEYFDLVVIDVSFISLDKIVPHLKKYIGLKGSVIALVKPQFELSRSVLNKKGVVKDAALITEVMEKISRVFQENKLRIVGECESPIEGENGNKEVLILAQPL